jgi:hypothetical protein
MIDFEHEINKIVYSVNKKIYSEETARYEALKLKCMADKLRRPLSMPIECALAVDKRTVNEDMRELTDLYRSGLLQKRYFIRDNMKILAVCEAFGLQFPGDESMANRLNMKYITEAIGDDPDDLDDPDGFGDLDDFGDLPEDEDFGEENRELRIVLDDCVLIYAVTGSEESFFELSQGDLDEVVPLDILYSFLSNRDKAKGPLKRIASAVEQAIQSNSFGDRFTKECLKLLLDVIHGNASYADLEKKASELDQEASDVRQIPAFLTGGISRNKDRFLLDLIFDLEDQYNCIVDAFEEYGVE